MVCCASVETPRCQCIVRDSSGEKVYEVTLPASTPAATLLLEVAKKLEKYPNQIALVYQNISQVIEITQGTQGSLEDVGLKTSHNRNSLMVQELSGSSSGSCTSSVSQSNASSATTSEAANSQDAPPAGAGSLQYATKNYKTTNFARKASRKQYEEEDSNFSSSLPIPSSSNVFAATPEYVGLVNQAMTCYLNSLLQALYMTPEFRNALYKWKFDGDKPTKSIPFQLQKLFLNLQTSSRCAVETTELTLSFGWGTGDVWHQHDVQELCRVMFDALEQEFKNTSQADLINHLYQGKMIDYVKCLECGREKSREDTFLDIPLPVRPYGSTIAYSSIEEAMRAFVTPEILDGNNQYHCENCNKKCNAHKGLKFSSFPYLLTLHLKRFDFDYNTMHRIKLNDKVVFPEILELDYFLKYPTAAQLETKCDDGSTADSALGDDAASTSAVPALPPELNSPPTDHELNEDEGIEISLGGGLGSSSSSSGSYSGSESCDHQAAPCDRVTTDNTTTLDPNSPGALPPEGGGKLPSESSPAREQNTPGNNLPESTDCDLYAGRLEQSVPSETDQTVPQAEEESASVSNSSNYLGSDNHSSRTQAELRYELYSIMIHSGSASGGHYYAYIKDFTTNQWFCFNDQSVTRGTVEDIERSYGGGPTRGYYSGVFSSSTNAYMLMYRFIDPDRNTLPMTPEEFPPHIKVLVEEMKAYEEQERRMRARDEETLKVKVCYQSNETKVFVHRDDPFTEALKQAYENLQLEGHVRKEDCRLVSYGISQDSRDCSLEDRENDSMGNVLAYLKTNRCSTDFLLETKHPHYPFPIYRPDDLRIDVCRVNVPREEVLGVQQVQVPIDANVFGLKKHLRLLMPDLLPPPPKDLVLVLHHYSTLNFLAWHHLSDDQLLIADKINPSAYYKIFVAALTPALAADLEGGFKESNFHKFLRKVENVVILHIALPEVNEDILERMMIPVLNKQQKTIENNNKQDQPMSEVTASASNAVAEDETVTTSAVTSSDQSTSEDSSLTDSERTIIGEPPQLEDGQLSSPSDSEQLSSPETNMVMEINGDVVDDLSDQMDNRQKSNREYYIKVTPYTQNNQRMVKIVVDRSAEWSLVEKCLEPCCGVPRQYLLVTTGSGDVARPSDVVRGLFTLKHHDYLSVRLHRPLTHNELKKKLYRFLPNSTQPFQYLCDWIVVRGQSVGESKRSLLKYLEKRNFLHTPFNRCRLRRKNWKTVGRPWLDSDTWEEPMRHPEELLLEELQGEDPVTGHHLVPVFVRRFYPSNPSFSSFQEIVIDTTQPFNLVEQISKFSMIPVEDVNVARSSYNFPWDVTVSSVWREIDWFQELTILSDPNFCLDPDDDTLIILFKDAREEKKELVVSDVKWPTQVFSARGDRRTQLAVQSPRKEKPLKIYLQSSNNSDNSNTTSASSNTSSTSASTTSSAASSSSNNSAPVPPTSTNNAAQGPVNFCYVPPPDYD